MTDRVTFFDTTLRDGEQSPGAAMTLDGKLKIARVLAALGVDVIEAGFPVSSPQQAEAVRAIVAALEDEDPVICALARAKAGDLEAAGAALEGGRRTRIHTFIATSDIHIAAKFSAPRFGASMAERRRSIVRMTQDAVAQARTFTDDVEFSAEDAGRTDHGFLCDVVEAAVEAGATTINIPDTTGYCTPQSYAALFEAVRDCVDPGAVTLSTHCHDDLGLAVANTLAGVEAGARQVEVTVNGLGERAGNASIEEVAMALRVRSDQYGVTHGLDTTRLGQASRLVAVVTGFPVAPNKAVVGSNAFAHEAGIHQHGVLQDRETYEIMSAADVGATAESIRLGRHSGRHGLFARLDRLGLEVADADRDTVYTRFVALADRKKEIYDADLHLIANPTAMTDSATPLHARQPDGDHEHDRAAPGRGHPLDRRHRRPPRRDRDRRRTRRRDLPRPRRRVRPAAPTRVVHHPRAHRRRRRPGRGLGRGLRRPRDGPGQGDLDGHPEGVRGGLRRGPQRPGQRQAQRGRLRPDRHHGLLRPGVTVRDLEDGPHRGATVGACCDTPLPASMRRLRGLEVVSSLEVGPGDPAGRPYGTTAFVSSSRTTPTSRTQATSPLPGGEPGEGSWRHTQSVQAPSSRTHRHGQVPPRGRERHRVGPRIREDDSWGRGGQPQLAALEVGPRSTTSRSHSTAS